MSIAYQQVDVTGLFPFSVCYTQSDIRTLGRRKAKEGGTAGTADMHLTHDTGGLTTACMLQWSISPVDGVAWNSGNWSVRVEVSVGNTNLKFQSVSFCHMRETSPGKWTSLANMGEKVFVLGPTLSVGVHTLIAPGMAGVASPLAGDQVLVAVKVFNTSIVSPTFVSFKSSQLIKAPFTPPATPGRVQVQVLPLRPTVELASKPVRLDVKVTPKQPAIELAARPQRAGVVAQGVQPYRGTTVPAVPAVAVDPPPETDPDGPPVVPGSTYPGSTFDQGDILDDEGNVIHRARRGWSPNVCDVAVFGSKVIDDPADPDAGFDRPFTAHPMRGDFATLIAADNHEVCKHQWGHRYVDPEGWTRIAYCYRPWLGPTIEDHGFFYVSRNGDSHCPAGFSCAVAAKKLPPTYMATFYSEADLCGPAK